MHMVRLCYNQDMKKILSEGATLFKGAVGAMIAYSAIGMLQYLGAHIPDMIQAISATALSWGNIRFRA